MKLVDANGRFQFIKNEQVAIDKALLKFTKLKAIEVAKKAVDTSDIKEDCISLVGNADYQVDDKIRKLILSLEEENLVQYLGSSDAVEFNKLFTPILKAEVNANKYSIDIPDNRWFLEPCGESSPISENNFRKIWGELKKLISKNEQEKIEKEASLHVEDFFKLVHVEANKEREFLDRLGGYFTLIRNAALMHQSAQLDELCQRVMLNIYESVLFVNGFNRYITFDNIEKLKCSGKRVVDIDYIQNFGRVIPSSVIEKKLHCDEMCVFDNYCVMYYDPTGAIYKAPMSARRDPVLFGLINHSNKLYYIADWIDDKCDLTLDKIAEQCNIERIK